MGPEDIRASSEGRSAGAGSAEGFVEVMLEFFIGEFSCLITAPDQVVTRFGLGVESVEECPQTPADPIANNRIADLSTDRVSHGHRVGIGGPSNETDSK
jgi:hypothetical protein